MRKICYYENCQANFQKKKEICRKEIQPLEFKLLNIVVGGLVAKLCLTLSNPTDCSLSGSSIHGDSPGKNTGVGYHFLLQKK